MARRGACTRCMPPSTANAEKCRGQPPAIFGLAGANDLASGGSEGAVEMRFCTISVNVTIAALRRLAMRFNTALTVLLSGLSWLSIGPDNRILRALSDCSLAPGANQSLPHSPPAKPRLEHGSVPICQAGWKEAVKLSSHSLTGSTGLQDGAKICNQHRLLTELVSNIIGPGCCNIFSFEGSVDMSYVNCGGVQGIVVELARHVHYQALKCG